MHTKIVGEFRWKGIMIIQTRKRTHTHTQIYIKTYEHTRKTYSNQIKGCESCFHTPLIYPPHTQQNIGKIWPRVPAAHLQ